MQFSQVVWYRTSFTWINYLLMPLSWLFASIVKLRRWLYSRGIFKVHQFPVPVIVVGNITVGGTGKSPCIKALSSYLIGHGYKPGIVSRGAGGQRNLNPVLVSNAVTTKQVGDEAIMLANSTKCPLVVCTDRSEAVNFLLKRHPECDVVLSDDGLQHYRMGRDIEIAMVDGERMYGNGCLLPAGPLREPKARLKTVDYQVVNGKKLDDMYSMQLVPQKWVSVKNAETHLPLNSWQDTKVHAIAGIGNPNRFFNQLNLLGYDVSAHPFPDHYSYKRSDIHYRDGLPVLMTEKDAVKCADLAHDNHWYLQTEVKVDEALLHRILVQLQGLRR